MARPAQAFDDGDDQMRRKFAVDVLPRGFAVIDRPRHPGRIVRRLRHAACRQHGRDCCHDLGCDAPDLGIPVRPLRAEAVLTAFAQILERLEPWF